MIHIGKQKFDELMVEIILNRDCFKDTGGKIRYIMSQKYSRYDSRMASHRNHGLCVLYNYVKSSSPIIILLLS